MKAVNGLRLYATPAHPQVITLTTELPGDTDTPGPMADFDPTRPERWEVVRMLPGALLYDALSGGTPINPSTFVYDPSSVVVPRRVPEPDLWRRLFDHVRTERQRHLFAVRHVHPQRGAGAGTLALLGFATIGLAFWRRRGHVTSRTRTSLT